MPFNPMFKKYGIFISVYVDLIEIDCYRKDRYFHQHVLLTMTDSGQEGREHGIRRTVRVEYKIAIQFRVDFRDVFAPRFGGSPGCCGLSVKRGMGCMHRIREWNNSVHVF